MNTPQPLPADRLSAMLSGAKNVMKKVESGDYSTGNIDTTSMVSSDALLEGNSIPQQYHQQPAPQHYQPNGVPMNYNTSKLPQAIKEAMLNSPQVNMMSPNHTFTLNDVSPDLIEKPMHMPQARPQQYQPQYQQPAPQYQQPLAEAYYQQPVPTGMVMVNEAQLKEMVKNHMMEFMADSFTKNLSEDVVKKSILSLIKEGKITATAKKPAAKPIV